MIISMIRFIVDFAIIHMFSFTFLVDSHFFLIFMFVCIFEVLCFICVFIILFIYSTSIIIITILLRM